MTELEYKYNAKIINKLGDKKFDYHENQNI